MVIIVFMWGFQIVENVISEGCDSAAEKNKSIIIAVRVRPFIDREIREQVTG